MPKKPRKPSKMKRTGKAKPSARSKAALAASKLGTGVARKGVTAIEKARKARKKALKELG